MATWKDFGLQHLAADQSHFPGCLSLVTRPGPPLCNGSPICIPVLKGVPGPEAVPGPVDLVYLYMPLFVHLFLCMCVLDFGLHTPRVSFSCHTAPASRVQCVTRPTPHRTPCAPALSTIVHTTIHTADTLPCQVSLPCDIGGSRHARLHGASTRDPQSQKALSKSSKP